MQYFIPIYTAGILTADDLVNEYYEKRLIPLLAIVPRDDLHADPLIPLFLSLDYTKWCKRHKLGMDVIGGHYALHDPELERFLEEGWNYQVFHPTRRLRPDEVIRPEVYDYSRQPVVTLEGNYKGRVCGIKKVTA